MEHLTRLSQQLNLEHPNLLQLRLRRRLRILNKPKNPEPPTLVLNLIARTNRRLVGINERLLRPHEHARRIVRVKKPGLVLKRRFALTHGGDSRRDPGGRGHEANEHQPPNTPQLPDISAALSTRTKDRARS